MKKIVSLLLALLLLFSAVASLAACTPTPADDHVTKVAYLSGSTGIGMAKMIADNAGNEKYEFSKFDGATDLREELLAAGCDIDIAALPTNLASLVYNKTNGRYKVIALNTLGVLYIATNGIVLTSLQDLIGKTVFIPEAAPGYVLRYVLEANGIHVTDSDTDTTPGVRFDYTYNLDSLPTMLAAGVNPDNDEPVQIGLLPEPKLTVTQVTAQKNGAQVSVVFDVTEEWDKVCETPLVQGCLVASASYIEQHVGLLGDFMKEYEASVAYMKKSDNLEAAADIVVSLKILPQKPIAIKAIPRCNLTYTVNDDMQTALSAYLAVLHAQNAQAIGGKLPDDNFYYSFETYVAVKK